MSYYDYPASAAHSPALGFQSPPPQNHKLQKPRPHAATLPNNGIPKQRPAEPIVPPLPTLMLPASLSPGGRPRSISLGRPGEYFVTDHRNPPPPVPTLRPEVMRQPFHIPRPHSENIAFPMPELPSDPGYLLPGGMGASGPYGQQPSMLESNAVYPYPLQHSHSDPSPSSTMQHPEPTAEEMEHAQMRHALALSMSEQEREVKRKQAEEEEAQQLALALEASVLDKGKELVEEGEWEEYDPAYFASPTTAGPSSTFPTVFETPSSFSHHQPLPPDSESVPEPAPTSFNRRPLPMNADEALARQIAMEGLQERDLRDRKIIPPIASVDDPQSSFPVPTLPSYTEAVSSSSFTPGNVAGPSSSSSSRLSEPTASTPATSEFGFPTSRQEKAHIARSTSAEVVSPTAASPTILRPHSQSVGAGQVSAAQRAPPNIPQRPHTAHIGPGQSFRPDGPDRVASASGSMMMGRSDSMFTLDTESVSESHESAPGALEHFSEQTIEDDLARGVSIAFTPPPIQTTNHVQPGVFPNIISLPYGKCPPIHIMATSWRHLLRLMARLSETRIEPTIEAIAAHKSAINLRSVIQFVRLHPSSNDWKTILYLSADMPVPKNHPQSWRWSATNVNSVPYSYSLTKVVSVGGPDSEVSKSYMIPPHPETPYPTLPISLPTLAMYLQSALMMSRRAVGDKTSGLGKLAKLIDTCYPGEMSATTSGVEGGDNNERSGRMRVFKKLIGRGGRDVRQGVNDETYDMVTPFRLDDF